MEAGLLRAHQVQVTHGPAHDAAQHVAAPVLGRQHAFGDHKRHAAKVVGHDAVAGLERAVHVLPRCLGARQHQGAHHVDVVVVVLALHDGHEPLEPHAGVYARARQVGAGAGRTFLVLHEDQVPDLDEPVPVLVRAARRAAGDGVPVVVEDFRARPARPGVAHAPEVVRCADADDAAVRQPGDLAPQACRLLVFGIHRDQQLVGRDAEVARQQGPGMLNGERLEVVAKTEVAQHLEECVVPGGVADIVEVVVLAARAHAFLGGGGARVGPALLAGEDVLELHHAAVGEQQRRVVARHQRAAWHDLVPMAGEVVQEGGADVVAAGHGVGGSSYVRPRA